MTRILALAIAVVALVAACGGAATSTPGPLTPSPGGFITVRDAWARPASAGMGSAAYLTIVNGQLRDDALVGVSTAAAASAQLHETTTDNGMTGMHPVGSIPIRAGQTVALEPGGFHIMLDDLTEDLQPGGTFQLTLTFEQTGPVTTLVDVRDR